MKNGNETKEKLLASAKSEFLEKGYLQASLRNICRNAGVTTGALYFFFRDKEDLFASLVEEPVTKLLHVITQHFAQEMGQADRGNVWKEDFSHDKQAVTEVIHYIYQYYGEFQLILTKSQGSRFAQCIDQFVSMTEKHYRLLADKMADQRKTERVDDYMIHWISHMNIDIFYQLEFEKTSKQENGSILEYIKTGNRWDICRLSIPHTLQRISKIISFRYTVVRTGN